MPEIVPLLCLLRRPNDTPSTVKAEIMVGKKLLLCSTGLLFLLVCTGCPSAPKEKAAADYANAGTEAMAARDWSQAISQFSLGLELSPNDKGLLFGRAAAYLAKAKDSYTIASGAAAKKEITTAEEQAKAADGFFDLAKKDIAKLLELDAQYTDAYYVRGCIEMYTGDWNAAIESFSTCIKQKPDSPFAWQRRGEIYAYVGDSANSILDLKKAAELGYVDSRKTTTPTDAADKPAEKETAAPK